VTLFITSILVLVALLVPIGILAKRRPVGTWVSWGEAMAGAGYVFFVMFWAYGVVPHQWLTWADNELFWRPDVIVVGPGKILQSALPFTITKQTLRDLVVVVIYGILLTGNIVLIAKWQARGAEKPGDEVESSRYGRPLVKQG
jgi:hypothetical protein